MRTVKGLHDKAMNLSDAGLLARRKGDTEKAKDCFGLALQYEREAAIRTPTYAEPTRSILFRSAAQLALDCDRVDDARWLIDNGLSGRPPEDIRAELTELERSIP